MNFFGLINILSPLVKPSKETVILWIKDALQRIQIENDIFNRTILRNPELLFQSEGKNDDEVSEEGVNEEDYDLIQEEDYKFSDID